MPSNRYPTRIGLLSLVFLMVSIAVACSCESRPAADRRAGGEAQSDACQRTAVGSHRSAVGRYTVEVSQLDAGIERLELRDSTSSVIWSHSDDISSLLWLPDESGFAFSTSPVYGTPGLHQFSIASKELRLLVGSARTGVPGYPQGAEWISLCAARSSGDGFVLDYIFYSHVDSAAFERFPEGGVRRHVAAHSPVRAR